jgi:hypothetical protein
MERVECEPCSRTGRYPLGTRKVDTIDCDEIPLALAIYGYPISELWHGFDARRRIVAFIQKAFDPVQSQGHS